MPHADPLKADLYREFGFGGDVSPYEALLLDAGLSKPSRARISPAKRDRVRDLLEARFFRVCGRGDCNAAAKSLAGPRTPVPAAAQRDCEVCGGSVNRRAVDEMVLACRRAGWSRLCIVGGSPVLHHELESLVGGRIGLRLIDGSHRRTQAQAQGDGQWADRVVIWGSTILDHKVSTLYGKAGTIPLARRSIAELAQAVIRAAAPMAR